mgnify:CR=1 FL=1
MPPPGRPNIVTLLTDFGTSDGYVAAMKGVILSINPAAAIVDVTHDIPPQDIHAAAFVLSQCATSFPSGTVHLVVVDPEVGSSRRALAIATPNALFLAPDNGVISLAIDGHLPEPAARELTGPPLPERRPVPPTLRALSIENRALFLPSVSPTFHGRDMFAPVAAHLAAGVPLQTVGPPVADLNLFEVPSPLLQSSGAVTGWVVHIDRFGNLITNVREGTIKAMAGDVQIDLGGTVIQGLSRTYAEGGQLMALIGSHGCLEVAARNGSAANVLNIGRWSPVHIIPEGVSPAGG